MEERKIAVLIDGENISHNDIDDIFQEIKRDGRILTARLYGSYDKIKPWEKAVNEYSIQLRTQFNYVSGKNTSDSALIIDAMDILYKDQVDTFYILSSDSDFTNLIKRIKESNKVVVGVGEKKTPEAVIKACNKFIYIENLGNNVASTTQDKEESNIVPLSKIYLEIYKMFNESNKEVKLLSSIKDFIIGQYSDFDTQNYPGQPKKFKYFLKKIPGIEVYLQDDNTTLAARVVDENKFEEFMKKQTNEAITTTSKEIKQTTSNEVKEVRPTLNELKDFILDKFNDSDDGQLNLHNLSLSVKRAFKKYDFKVKNYDVTTFYLLLKKISKKFKFDAQRTVVWIKK